MSHSLNGGQLIVDYLIREKVPYAFGLCGHGNIGFIDALYERSDDIDTVSVHHETVAGFMADVYYRVSVCGDGAFFMHASVLGTAVEYNIAVVWVVWNNYAYASIRGLQRGYLGGRELATDFKLPNSQEPYNPDFAAMAKSAGVAGVTVDRPEDLGEAIRAAIASDRPFLIDAKVGADLNPVGAGVWELPGLGVGKPGIGERFEP